MYVHDVIVLYMYVNVSTAVYCKTKSICTHLDPEVVVQTVYIVTHILNPHSLPPVAPLLHPTNETEKWKLF